MKNINEILKKENVTIIDVRTEEEFSEGHLENSINIPLHEVQDRVEELRLMQPMVLCCRSGQRSGRAMEFLQSQGLTELCNGGGWSELLDLNP